VKAVEIQGVTLPPAPSLEAARKPTITITAEADGDVASATSLWDRTLDGIHLLVR
jgi:hypothetical protein